MDYTMLPTFAVADAFEDRFGSLMAHGEAILNMTAPMTQRAFLILQGLKAGDPSQQWSVESVKKTMFERGYWHESLVRIEIELVERLIYTPEQYLAKKTLRDAEAAAMAAAMEGLNAFDPSSPPQP